MKLNNLSDLDDELFNEIAQSFDTPNLIELLGMRKIALWRYWIPVCHCQRCIWAVS